MAEKAAKTAEESKRWDAKLSHKVLHTVITVVITLAVVGMGAYAYVLFTKDTKTTISNANSKPNVTTVAAPNSEKAHFDEANFSMDLPSDWKRLQPVLTGPYREYKYQAGLKNADNRWLSVYVDALPLNMAVNKEVAVHSEGTQLSHGLVSDSCNNFTAKPTPTSLTAPAKWDGVDFICDMDSTTRNVVGTSAPGSINKVELQNVGFTTHSYFFRYEDNNFNPDYNIFYDMLDSFRAK